MDLVDDSAAASAVVAKRAHYARPRRVSFDKPIFKSVTLAAQRDLSLFDESRGESVHAL